MKQLLQNDYHNGSQNQNPPHTTADLKKKSSCLHLESETPLSFYYCFFIHFRITATGILGVYPQIVKQFSSPKFRNELDHKYIEVKPQET